MTEQQYAYERNGYEDEMTYGQYETDHPACPASVAANVAVGVEESLAPTPSRDFGPFFVQLAPFRGVLTPMGHSGGKPVADKPAAPGDWLLVQGTVRNTLGQPVPYATLDVWQAGPDAEYDYEEKDGVFKPYLSYISSLNDHSLSREYDYRARVLSDEAGRFEYQTVIPPPYLDTEDNTWRYMD